MLQACCIVLSKLLSVGFCSGGRYGSFEGAGKNMRALLLVEAPPRGMVFRVEILFATAAAKSPSQASSVPAAKSPSSLGSAPAAAPVDEPAAPALTLTLGRVGLRGRSGVVWKGSQRAVCRA